MLRLNVVTENPCPGGAIASDHVGSFVRKVVTASGATAVQIVHKCVPPITVPGVEVDDTFEDAAVTEEIALLAPVHPNNVTVPVERSGLPDLLANIAVTRRVLLKTTGRYRDRRGTRTGSCPCIPEDRRLDDRRLQ
jgi:hypothetical protein